MRTNNHSFHITDKDLVDLSILEIFVLNRLQLSRTPLIRYQILQEIRDSIKEVSTGKIYRIIDKFINKGLIEKTDTSSENEEYKITNKGINTIQDAQSLVYQFSSNVIVYYEKLLPDIKNFIDAKERTLLYDYEQIYNTQLLNFILENTDELYYLDDNNAYEFFHNSLQELKHTRIEDNIIREPNNYFQTIICVYHDDINRDLNELHRVLDKNGKLVIIETDPFKVIHFVHKILFNQFGPPFLKKTKKFLDLDSLDKQRWKFVESKDLEGLSMIKLEKLE